MINVINLFIRTTIMFDVACPLYSFWIIAPHLYNNIDTGYILHLSSTFLG